MIAPNKNRATQLGILAGSAPSGGPGWLWSGCLTWANVRRQSVGDHMRRHRSSRPRCAQRTDSGYRDTIVWRGHRHPSRPPAPSAQKRGIRDRRDSVHVVPSPRHPVLNGVAVQDHRVGRGDVAAVAARTPWRVSRSQLLRSSSTLRSPNIGDEPPQFSRSSVTQRDWRDIVIKTMTRPPGRRLRPGPTPSLVRPASTTPGTPRPAPYPTARQKRPDSRRLEPRESATGRERPTRAKPTVPRAHRSAPSSEFATRGPVRGPAPPASKHAPGSVRQSPMGTAESTHTTAAICTPVTGSPTRARPRGQSTRVSAGSSLTHCRCKTAAATQPAIVFVLIGGNPAGRPPGQQASGRFTSSMIVDTRSAGSSSTTRTHRHLQKRACPSRCARTNPDNGISRCAAARAYARGPAGASTKLRRIAIQIVNGRHEILVVLARHRSAIRAS